jgi:hypothetical protein
MTLPSHRLGGLIGVPVTFYRFNVYHYPPQVWDGRAQPSFHILCDGVCLLDGHCSEHSAVR